MFDRVIAKVSGVKAEVTQAVGEVRELHSAIMVSVRKSSVKHALVVCDLREQKLQAKRGKLAAKLAELQ